MLGDNSLIRNQIIPPNQIFFNYNEFNNINILKITGTNKCNYMLLKNGVLLSWGGPGSLKMLGRKCKITADESAKPLKVDIPNKLKIIEIVCGDSHCLAKSINGEVISWGDNSLGQFKLLAGNWKNGKAAGILFAFYNKLF